MLAMRAASLSVCLVLSLLSLGSSEVVTIVQDSSLCNPAADNEACSTLGERISSNQPFSDHSVVRFSSGTHILTNVSANDMFAIKDSYNVSLIGYKGLCEIVCEQQMMFAFVNMTNLTIDGLSFVGCGAPLPEHLAATLRASQSFLDVSTSHFITLFMTEVVNLQLVNVSVTDSFGYGMLGHNVLGRSLITRSTFSYNNYNTSRRGCVIPDSSGLLKCAGGGLSIGYTDTLSCQVATPTQQLDITYSSFVSNVNLYSSVGSGLSVSLSQSNYGVHVCLDNVFASGNLATLGANIAIFQHGFTDNSSFTITNTVSSDANSLLAATDSFIVSHSLSYNGGGLWYSYGYAVSPDIRLCSGSNGEKSFQGSLLTVLNTAFIDNKATVGAGAYVWVFPNNQQARFEYSIHFERCDFVNNTGSSGAGIYINQLESITENFRAHFFLDTCRFSGNSFPMGQEIFSKADDVDLLNTLYLNSLQFASFSNCLFSQNLVTAIFAFNTRMHFYGNSTFEHNQGNGGGAMSIHGSSIMILHPNTHIVYNGNTAERGGAIFVSSLNYLLGALLCFWQLDPENALDLNNVTVNKDNLIDFLGIRLEFTDNSAESAGSVLYAGIRADGCSLSLSTTHPMYTSYNLFQQLFTLETLTHPQVGDQVSAISSDPSQVCLCMNGVPNCTRASETYSIFPGQSITLSLICVDRRSHPSPGNVLAHFNNNPNNLVSSTKPDYVSKSNYSITILDEGQQSQFTGIGCTDLRYTTFSTPRNLTLHLKTSGTILAEKSTLVTIIVMACPLGFISENSRCVCVSFLDDIATCDIETQTISLEHPYWVGRGMESTVEYVKISSYCPLDYCVPDRADIMFSSEEGLNRQCASNRAGVLCGECAPGHSVIFGGNECWQCSNYFLLLVVVYAMAGLFLVFLLYFLNTLTVSVGAINGLIFYASIIQVNRAIFVPPNSLGQVLPLFVSWLNLDVGIRVCFYDGMNTFVKTWLQFVFPLYLLCILACVVIVSHYSSSASKIFTDKAVGVLTTILLLIFSRIQRLTSNCLAFQKIQHFTGDNQSYYVWSFDGSIEYIRSEHGVLFIIGSALFFLVIPPFIIVLLFAKQFQALSSYKYFRWVNKMKPLFDAYMGPYKDRYRGWTGLLLLVRQVLIIVNFSDPTPETNLFAILIVCLLLTMVAWYDGGVYRNWVLNIVECSFFLNLAITSAATWYVHPLDSINADKFIIHQTAVIYTSVLIALIEFVVIFLYALYVRIIDIQFKRSFMVKFQQSVLSLGQFPAQVKVTLLRRKKRSAVKESRVEGKSTIRGATTQLVTISSFMQEPDNGLRESLLLDNTSGV